MNLIKPKLCPECKKKAHNMAKTNLKIYTFIVFTAGKKCIMRKKESAPLHLKSVFYAEKNHLVKNINYEKI